MSPFLRRRVVPATPDRTVRGDPAVTRSLHAVPVDGSARAADGCSSTTSLLTVLVTFAIAVLLSLAVAARAFCRRRDVPGTPHESACRDEAAARSPRAVTADTSARAESGCHAPHGHNQHADDVSARAADGCSPTTSIHRVLVTLAIAVLLSVLVAARAIVHAGAGMPDGPMRTLTLAVGQATLRVADVTHVTWPWDRLAAALGNAPQPAVPPLLASGSTARPHLQATPTPLPGQTPHARAALIGVSPLPTSGRGMIQPPPADPPGTWEPSRHPMPTDAAREVRPVPELKRNLRKGYTPRPTPPAVPPSSIQLTTRSLRMAGNCSGGARPWGLCAPTSAARHHGLAARYAAGHDGGRGPHPARRRSVGRARAATAHQDPLWRPTPGHPLRLLVTGDSLPGYLGPILLNDAAARGPVRGAVDVHDGTGLTRPDFVDWSLVARQQVATYHPDAVVVWMGGNDFQNMTLPTGQVLLAGTPAWTQEYQRRVGICMRIWTHGGARRVYWLAMPPARDPSWAYDDAQIDSALRRAAARVSDAEYLDILGPITDHGRYADYVYENGQPELVREADGVHVNLAGSTIVAQEVLRVLVREWHLG